MSNMKIVYRSQDILVCDDVSENIRNMYFGPAFKFRQGSMVLGKQNLLNLEYYRNCFFPACFTPIRRALILGVGTGAIGRALSHIDADIEVDFVDISMEVLQVAHSFFNLGSCGKAQYYCVDAELFVSQSGLKYDYIFVDVWGDSGVPDFILKDDFWSNVGRLLGSRHAVVVNAPKGSFYDLLVAMSRQFGTVHAIQGSNTALVHFGGSENFEDDWIERDYQALVDVSPRDIHKTVLEINARGTALAAAF